KDALIRFRDRNGIALMLVAPLVLAAIMGAAFGGFGRRENASLSAIPVAIVDEDGGPMAAGLVNALESEDLAELLAPVEAATAAEARKMVEQGEVRAAVVIPAGFGDAVGAPVAPPATLALFTDPTSTFSPIVVEAVVTEMVNRFNAGSIGAQVAVEQLLEQQAALGPELMRLGQALTEIMSDYTSQSQGVARVVTLPRAGETEPPNPLAYFAPGMAILFLMFTLFDASRSLLDEEREGTLQRMMSSPTSFAQILAGKNAGVMLTGVLQMTILVLASSLLFDLSWGRSPLAVALMIMAVVAAAASLGALIVAFARDARQAGVIGSAIALAFAVLGGNFIDANAYPAWMQPLSKLTINRWALDGFTDLSLRGGGLEDVLLEAGVLFGMTAIFFTLAVWRLPRRFVR
ncbi:MAG: ABC transporter permease, partial [Chloroflexi bacterium]|nr:ABC transporter permease [Chloroflexota bacterium]